MSTSYLLLIINAVFFKCSVITIFLHKLPFDLWYPFKLDTPVKFLAVYSFQAYAAFSSVLIHYGFDTIYVCFILQMIYQVKLLKSRFLKISHLDVSSTSSWNFEATICKAIRERMFELQKIYRCCNANQKLIYS